MEIKNRHTGSVIATGDTIKEAVDDCKIHMAREMRCKHRESVTNCDKLHSCAQVDCPYCEIDRLMAQLVEARHSVQFWKDETRRAIEAGDTAYVKAMRLYATMVAENEELKETVKQVEQSASNPPAVKLW